MSISDSLDWLQLAKDATQAYTWLQQLLRQQAGQQQLYPSGEQEQVLWSLYWEQRTQKRLYQQHRLYVAYPFFRFAEADRAWPLLLWASELVPPGLAQRYWELRYDGSAPLPNHQWLDQAKQQTAAVDWAAALHRVCHDPEAALAALAQLAELMATHTNWKLTSVQPALSSRQLTVYETDASPGALHWSAQLGLFTPSYAAPETDIPTHWRQPLTHAESVMDNLALARLTPAAMTAFHQVQGQRYVGVSGTDRTKALTELIQLCAKQGKRTQLLAKERAILTRYERQLRTIGLEHLTFFLREEQTDLPLLKQQVQQFVRKPPTVPTYDDNRWRTELTRLNRQKRQLDAHYTTARQAVFGQQQWGDLLGHYLRAARRESKSQLAGQLQAKHFTFTPAEYQRIISAIGATIPLFEAVGTTKHPLNNLNAAIFIHQEAAESKAFINEKTRQLLGHARPLQQAFIQRQSQYADALALHYESYYRRLKAALQAVVERLEDSENTYGGDTLRSGERTLKILGAFQEKYRQVRQERAGIAQLLTQLRELHDTRQPFSFTWPNGPVKAWLGQLAGQLQDYERQLENWWDDHPKQLQEELVRLNQKTALPELELTQDIAHLEQQLEEFIDEWNALGLYQLPLAFQSLTLARQQKYLEDRVDELERTREGLLDYEPFYAWQRNWFSLPELARKSIQALLRSRPKDWAAAFSSWYFNECLQKYYHPVPATEERAALTYHHRASRLREWLPEVIRYQWHQRR
ncbi:MAG: hypothetical protein AAGJ82_14165, partial [Bacteroidota bacterium]